MINKIKTLFKSFSFSCEHSFVSDIQLRIVECTKCNKKYWYSYGDIYSKPNKIQERKNKIKLLS